MVKLNQTFGMESYIVVTGSRKKLIAAIVALVLAINVSSFALPEDTPNPLPGSSSASQDDNAPFSLHEPFGYFNVYGKYMLAKLRVVFSENSQETAEESANAIDPFCFDLEEILASPDFDPVALSGFVVGIDPGHQTLADLRLEPIAPGSEATKARQTGGCIGVRTSVPEYIVNLMVATRLSAVLNAAGATVVMTRTESDVTLSNIQRAELMNSANVDVWVRLHCDSASDAETRGCMVLTPSYVTSPDIFDHSYMLGALVLDQFCAVTGAPSLGIFTSESQTGFNFSQAPVIVVEMGCLSNPVDDIRLNRESYQSACAYGVFSGILSYYQQIILINNSVADALIAPAEGSAEPDLPGEAQPHQP